MQPDSPAFQRRRSANAPVLLRKRRLEQPRAERRLSIRARGTNGGWFIAYLGRNDAESAFAQTFGANTAHRLLWNGERDWKAVLDRQSPTSYYLNFTHDGKPINGLRRLPAFQQGGYTAWEYEHFYRNSTADGDASRSRS